MGWSFGGGYAQALAHHLSDRVEALALVASCVPPDWDGMREQINRMDRHFLAMSERPTTRAVERTIFHLMHLTATELPSAMASRTGLGEGDAEVLTTAIAEGLRDVDGVVGDYRVMDRPWGFDPSSIRTPTTIWQGDADDLVPAEWGERLQQSIPDATLVKVPGGTHYLWYQHWEDILGTLTRHP
jgi:pimeloyl-ACP methyl ester carboxylesterase